MGLEVVANATEKRFLTKMAAQHANNGASLEIADVVEDLIHFQRVSHRNLNWMRCT